MNYVKIKDGEVTLNFKDAGMYITTFCLVFCVMMADNFYYNYYGETKDNKVTIAAAFCFVFAFIYLLYRIFPTESPKKIKPPSYDIVSLPDRIFQHNDEVSRVEMSIKKFTERVPTSDEDTDHEDYDSSPSKMKTKRRSPRKWKEKRQQVLEVSVKTWSKKQIKWTAHYWLDHFLTYFGYKPDKYEVEHVNNSHKYILN